MKRRQIHGRITSGQNAREKTNANDAKGSKHCSWNGRLLTCQIIEPWQAQNNHGHARTKAIITTSKDSLKTGSLAGCGENPSPYGYLPPSIVFHSLRCSGS